MRLGFSIAMSATLAAVLFGLAPSAFCGALEVSVADEKGGPVKDAVVYAVPGAGAATARAERPVMDQVDKEFVPGVMPVPVGTAVSFPNHDNLRHHVYSFSEAKRFEIPLYMGTPADPVVFDRPGVVALGCNIHDWMSAYVFVLQTPFYAVTSADGKARIEGLPPGGYDVRVWHPRLKGNAEPPAKRLDVSEGAPAKAAFSVSLVKAWRKWRAPAASGRTGYR